ncbi:hypothetical protein FKM82_007106 [Ascaphus truei]
MRRGLRCRLPFPSHGLGGGGAACGAGFRFRAMGQGGRRGLRSRLPVVQSGCRPRVEMRMMAALHWGWRRCCSHRTAARGLFTGPGPRGRAARRGGAGEMSCSPASSAPFTLTGSLFWRSPYRRLHATQTACCCSKTNSEAKYKDPFKHGSSGLNNLYEDIKKELFITTKELKEMCEYYFDGKGKAFRPMLLVLMAQACNTHYNNFRLFLLEISFFLQLLWPWHALGTQRLYLCFLQSLKIWCVVNFSNWAQKRMKMKDLLTTSKRLLRRLQA